MDNLTPSHSEPVFNKYVNSWATLITVMCLKIPAIIANYICAGVSFYVAKETYFPLRFYVNHLFKCHLLNVFT